VAASGHGRWIQSGRREIPFQPKQIRDGGNAPSSLLRPNFNVFAAHRLDSRPAVDTAPIALPARESDISASENFRLAQHSGHHDQRNCFSRASEELIFGAKADTKSS
jgi:hypothetical protein